MLDTALPKRGETYLDSSGCPSKADSVTDICRLPLDPVPVPVPVPCLPACSCIVFWIAVGSVLDTSSLSTSILYPFVLFPVFSHGLAPRELSSFCCLVSSSLLTALIPFLLVP